MTRYYFFLPSTVTTTGLSQLVSTSSLKWLLTQGHVTEREGVSGGPVLKDEPSLFELSKDAVSPGLPSRITRTAGNIATAITGTLTSLAARSRSPSLDRAITDRSASTAQFSKQVLFQTNKFLTGTSKKPS